jgi:RNA polymerase sigma-70 factor (ECF subfamily)
MPHNALAEPDHPFDDEGRPPHASTAPAKSATPPDTPPNPDTLDAHYRDHANWLVAFLRRRFNRRDAEDLAQETFVRAAGAARNHVTLHNPRGFLAKIALRVVQDDARRQAARPALTSSDSLPDPASPSDQAETLLLKQVILALPPKLREVFLLSRVHGLTYAAIANGRGADDPRPGDVRGASAGLTNERASCHAEPPGNRSGRLVHADDPALGADQRDPGLPRMEEGPRQRRGLRQGRARLDGRPRPPR